MDDAARVIAEPLQFNPFLPEVHEDPYPLYRRLRAEDPVHHAFPGIWVLTRHADCVAVLRDHERFSNDFTTSQSYAVFVEQARAVAPELVDDRTRSLLAIDPPDHTRLRTLVNKAFTARAIEMLRPHMREVVDGLIAAMRERVGTVDLVAGLAYPLPVTIICEMLGVPESDREAFHGWSADLVPTIDPMVPIPALQRAVVAHEAFSAYLRELAAARRRAPGDDILSALIAAEDKGRSLSEEELLTTCILLLVAGHETTVNLISNGMLALLRNPNELARLRRDPSLIRSAIEEILRYDAPVQLDGRTVRAEVELGGRTVHPGEQVMTVLGAANRDPEVFAEPDRLDLAREDNRHVAFGGGIHFCLGATLARIEGQEAIGRLVAAFPGIELATDAPERRASITLRGLASLPVAVA